MSTLPQPTRRHDPEALRDQIRGAALRLFARNGYSGTSIQQIADAVGISKQLLLYHAVSKEALRQSVVDDIARAWTELLPRLLEAITSPPDRLEGVIDALAAFLDGHSEMARVVLFELISDSGQVAANIEGTVRPWMQVAADLIRQRQAEGVFDPDADPEAFLVGIATLLLGTIALLDVTSTQWPVGTPTDVWRRRRLREAVRMVRASAAAR